MYEENQLHTQNLTNNDAAVAELPPGFSGRSPTTATNYLTYFTNPLADNAQNLSKRVKVPRTYTFSLNKCVKVFFYLWVTFKPGKLRKNRFSRIVRANSGSSKCYVRTG